MDRISERMYDYLCDKIVGTEDVVKCKREFFNIRDNIHNTNLCKLMLVISSGSKAEGLDLPGSDYDVMMVNPTFPVYDIPVTFGSFLRTSDYCNTSPLIMETEYAHPGFALLRVHDYYFCLEKFIVDNGSGQYVSGKVMKSKMVSQFNSNGTYLKINGPCLSDGQLDIAVCLKCDDWPSVARNWSIRPRVSGWPTFQLISNICQKGVLLVPVGSKSDSQDENPLEWRISFSVPEKLLIASWNHTQILCYALLKILLNDVLKRNTNVNKLICSYFLKTTMFWMSEEYVPTIWKPSKLLNCFLLCLERLIYLNELNNIPNYFIPEHNMIDRIIPGQSRSELVNTLRTLHSIGWYCLLECETLQEFNQLSRFSITNKLNCEHNLFGLIPLALNSVFSDDDLTIIEGLLTEVMNQKLSATTRSLYLFQLAAVCNKIATETVCPDTHTNNQTQYRKQKQWLSFALIGSYTNSMSGWLLIALFFYLNSQYFESLYILQQCLVYYQIKIRSKASAFMNENEENIFQQIFHRTTFFRTLQWLKMFPLELNNQRNKPCAYIDEFIDLKVQCSPSVFLHYLNFLCYHKLGFLEQRQQSLRDLIWTTEHDIYLLNLEDLVNACCFVSKAFDITGDYHNSSHWQSITQFIGEGVKTKLRMKSVN